MSQLNIKALLEPSSIAVIGAKNSPESIGYWVVKNLIASQYDGPIMPVSLKSNNVCGILAYEKPSELPIAPDLGAICTPIRFVAKIVKELGEVGCKAVILFSDEPYEGNAEIWEKIGLIAAKYNIRVLGPSSLGVLNPRLKLNVSLAHVAPPAGDVAVISQSAAFATSMIDWAETRGVGFSCFISIGTRIDVNFADLIDYLSRDRFTKSIALYVDNIIDTRRFMSAARAAAFKKPIVVVRSSSNVSGPTALLQDRRNKISYNTAYTAAFQRSGMLRVNDTFELLSAIKTIATIKRSVRGDKMLIISNGGSPAYMAIDVLIKSGCKLAELSYETEQKLLKVLPNKISSMNPINILGGVDAEAYSKVIDIVLEDAQYDALLIIHAPQVTESCHVTAEKLIPQLVKNNKKGPIIFTSWMGETSGRIARQTLIKAGIPSYGTPEVAVNAFNYIVKFRRHQKQLIQTPETLADLNPGLIADAKMMVEKVMRKGVKEVNEKGVNLLLAAYGIMSDTTLTKDEVNKFRIEVVDDAAFGPIICLGEAGGDWDIDQDAGVALPPLNMALSRYLVVGSIKQGIIRERSLSVRLNMEGLCEILTRISQMIIDFPMIKSISIDPLELGRSGYNIKVDKVNIGLRGRRSLQKLAILPYPKELESIYTMKNGKAVLLRPIRHEDEPQHQAFDLSLTADDRYLRYFGSRSKFSHFEMAMLTQIDYEREMAFIASAKNPMGQPETLGVVQAIFDWDSGEAEFAISVRSDLKGQGLGKALMLKIIAFCRQLGLKNMVGFTMPTNSGMIKLAKYCGFKVTMDYREGNADLKLKLND
ncbi:bifunctional acetate--CoA ligase family protein/GNAT family N-acetyltransferase [Moritella viscosa]|uniref:bifunctional acetate--CoA ligase family protein/GNAT family N-acetyltransferase n=1 Tax=Moritella viscosa TaxID=80854 RepID=UPI00091637FE|nr:GNAT family N-acetyltransferase [Moritella viscosa]SGZ07073.1 Putative uncharacterized protein [Moritella viscosa]